MSKRGWLVAFAWCIATIGVGLIWISTSWHVVLGVFLMLWANNTVNHLYQHDRIRAAMGYMGGLRQEAQRIRNALEKARPAAPGGDAWKPSGTNTEAEVAGKERP